MSWKRFTIASYLSRLWWGRRLRREGRSWTELQEFPKLSPPQKRIELAKRLLAQVRYFASRPDALPAWRDCAKIRDPEDLWQIWPSLPIMTKDHLREQFDPRFLKRLGIRGNVDSTGGSTGEPTFFLHDAEMRRATATANFYARLRLGWLPGMATIVLWGSERDIGRAKNRKHSLYVRCGREYLIDGYQLTVKTFERVINLIRRHHPVAIYGFTSMLEFLAQEALRKGVTLPSEYVRTAWNGGEMLFKEQAAAFQSAFGIPILNLYGGRELGAMAYQAQIGESLRVLRPWLYVEIVDDFGRPVEPGESGRMLWTSTVCQGTPFLRYEIGDLATYDSNGADESGIFALRELHGRVGSIFQLPNGKRISGLYWNHLLKEYPEVKQFQVILPENGSVKILLRGMPFSGEREAYCRRILSLTLGSTPVEIRWVESIPRTSQGKLVQVIRGDRTLH